MAVAGLAFGDQKVDLHTAGGIIAGCIVVEIELMTAGGEHLGDDIFHEEGCSAVFLCFHCIKES